MQRAVSNPCSFPVYSNHILDINMQARGLNPLPYRPEHSLAHTMLPEISPGKCDPYIAFDI